MNTKINLFAVTIDQVKDLEEKFKITKEAGFDGIDLMDSAIEIWLNQGHTLEELSKLPKKYDLPVYHIGYLSEWQTHNGVPLVCRILDTAIRTPEDTVANLKGRLKKYFEHCQALGVKNALTPVTTEDAGSLNESVESFSILCEEAKKYGLRCGVEFIGWAKRWNNLKTTYEIVEKANLDNGGLLVDAFHFHSGDSKIADLRKVAADKIFIVHMNDVRKMPREEMRDSDQVMPGKGIIPLKEILTVLLREKKFPGPLSIELFNESYWNDDPVKIAKQCKAGMDEVLAEV
jgi:sugar phosphate isomerase/epimerase